MRKRTVKLWRLNEDGHKLFAGTVEASDPRELVLKWSLFLATAERHLHHRRRWPHNVLQCCRSSAGWATAQDRQR